MIYLMRKVGFFIMLAFIEMLDEIKNQGVPIFFLEKQNNYILNDNECLIIYVLTLKISQNLSKSRRDAEKFDQTMEKCLWLESQKKTMIKPKVQCRFSKLNMCLCQLCSFMFNLDIYLLNLSLTKSMVLLNLGLKSFVIRVYMTENFAKEVKLIFE